MRILGLFPPVAPGRIGGIEESARIAWDAITKSCDTTQLFVYRSRKDEAPGWGGQATHAPTKLRSIYEARRSSFRPDLTLLWHLHLLRLLPFFPPPRGRIVVFLHGVEAWVPHRGLIGKMIPSVDLFLSNTKYTWERFLENHPKAATTPHITVSLGIGEPAATVSQPEHPPAAVMVSRLVANEDYKGHKEVLQAWPRVLETIPDAQLWIVGEGDLRPGLESLARSLGIASQVRFWGQVSESQKNDLLIRARCVALPSKGEGFGLVYLEGMRVGRPCLVSDADAARKVVDPPTAGLAVDPDDQYQVANALIQLLSPGERWDGWSEAARLRYEEHYTERHFQERLLVALTDPDE